MIAMALCAITLESHTTSINPLALTLQFLLLHETCCNLNPTFTVLMKLPFNAMARVDYA